MNFNLEVWILLKRFKSKKLKFFFGFLLILTFLLGLTQHANSEEVYRYHSYDEIESELKQLEANYPNIAKVYDIGDTWEGRDIWAIKISDNPTQNEDEPEVLFIGGHHAREWISVEVPFYLAKYLVENYNTNNYVKKLVDNGEIWIVPLLNPDGYEYSRTTYRYWRKNRRNNGDGTFGVDLNRNYGYKWGGPGSSGETKSDIYRGPEPFSEPETQAIRDLILNNEFKIVISYHSYSQKILYPWGYTNDPPPDEALLKNIAQEMSDIIKSVNGEYYEPLQSSDLYPWPNDLVTGDLTDWVYGTLGIPAFTIELRPKPCSPLDIFCNPLSLFDLPEDQIKPTFEENLPAALYVIEWTQLVLDLIFTIDVTGSMWDDIDAVKASATEIVNEISNKVADWRIAVVDFQDFPVHPYGCEPDDMWPGYPGDWPYRTVLPFSTDKTAIINAINSLQPLCGMDWPESIYSALIRSINTEGLGEWRKGVKKVIILMTDSYPHDPEPFTGYTMADVKSASESVDPVAIYPVFIGWDSIAQAYAEEIAEQTGGKVFYAPTPSDVVDAILEAVEVALNAPIAEANGPYKGIVGSPITFDASGSYDPDGEIVSYEWDWDNDGIYDESTISPTITHTWDAEFSGTVRLRVTDNDGLTSIDTAPVEVTAPAITGDLDSDGDIDQNDLNILLTYRNQPASECPECDIDGDGIITVLDARKLVLLCTRPRCATE